MTKSKILFSILTTFILSTGSVFAITSNPVSPILYNSNITFLCSDPVNDKVAIYNSNGGVVLNVQDYQCNTEYTWSEIYHGGLTTGSFSIIEYEPGAYSGNINGDDFNIAIQTNGYIGQMSIIVDLTVSQVASVFSFVDRGISNNTGTGLSGNLIPSVSNLWPIVMIILGIIITFYVLDQIIKMFKKAMKEKGIKPHHNDYGGKVTYDDHANVKFIEFDKKK